MVKTVTGENGNIKMAEKSQVKMVTSENGEIQNSNKPNHEYECGLVT